MSWDLSRRNLMGTFVTGAVATIVAFASRAHAQSAAHAQGTAKETKQQAAYQDNPKEGKMCAVCTYFAPPESCQKVDGDIKATGWCKFFQQKS